MKLPELYPGQAAVIADHLAQEEALLAANQEQLKAETDPAKRANILRLIASQSGQVGSRRRALQKALADDDADTSRESYVRVRLSTEERQRLDDQSQAAGQTLSQFIRERCGL